MHARSALAPPAKAPKVPGSQEFSHTSWPVRAVHAPCGHATHADCAVAGWKEPAAQGVGCAARAVQKLPAGHGVQEDELAAEKKPDAHATSVAVDVPAGHDEPAGHGAGAAPASQKNPAGQGVVPFVAPPAQEKPAAQRVGTAVPTLQKDPSGQGPSHSAMVLKSEVPMRPAAHGVGDEEPAAQ